MTQESNQPIDLHLSVHESTDPSLLSAAPEQEAFEKTNKSDQPIQDEDNFGTDRIGIFDPASHENVVDRQISIANISAG